MGSRALLRINIIDITKGKGVLRSLSTSSARCDDAKKLPVPTPKRIVEGERPDIHSRLIKIDKQEDVGYVSGVPEEHIKTRTVRIYQPAKNAMQSGTNNIHFWQIDFDNRERWENNLIGWSSTGDPHSNVKVNFPSADAAIEHCEKMGWKYWIQKPNVSNPKPRSYGANFAWNKRTRVSTK